MELSPDYPVMLVDCEYEALTRRPRRLHIHDWIYRRPTLPGKLYIVRDAEEVEMTQFPAGRYCRKCGCVQFLPVERVGKRTGRRWDQNDCNYLLKELF